MAPGRAAGRPRAAAAAPPVGAVDSLMIESGLVGREFFFIHHNRPVSCARKQRIHNRHPGGYRSDYRGRMDMENLQLIDLAPQLLLRLLLRRVVSSG